MGEVNWDDILRWRESGWNPAERVRSLEMELGTAQEHIRQLQDRSGFYRDQVKFLDAALEKAKKAPPGPEFARLLGELPQCPRCGAEEPWRSRSCCELGQLTGRVEGRQVADALMQEDA